MTLSGTWRNAKTQVYFQPRLSNQNLTNILHTAGYNFTCCKSKFTNVWVQFPCQNLTSLTSQVMYDKIHSSPTFVKADHELQESPRESGWNLPWFITTIMLWSDATHVAQFGQVKLWPIYLYLGNLSNYARCKPSDHTVHQAAYRPTVKWCLLLS